MSYTLTETGTLLTETIDDVTMPVDYKFATINDFVHSHSTNYEDLQSLCLGMATYIEGLENAIEDTKSREECLGFIEDVSNK